MTKRILIIADAYGKPSFAPRLRFLCDYWIQQGYEINVYTEKWQDLPFARQYAIHECTFYHNRWDWFIKTGWSLLTNWKDRYFSRWIRKEIGGQTFDLVFCTTFSTFPLQAAYKVAQWLHIPLYVDIRDLDEQVPGAQYQYHRQWWTIPFRQWYQKVHIRRRNRVLKRADCVTTVSPWHVDFIRKFNGNVHLIYNGYDPAQFYPENISADTFYITYIGRLYEFQSLDLIKQAIQELNLPNCELNLHLPDYHYIPISEVGNEIRRSSIMLVLTSTQTHGMMTTKFFEAIGCEKPVLCIPSDKGCLADTIVQTNAGLASDNIDEIKNFILDKYQEWKQVGFTRQAVSNKEMFSRLHQAQQFEQLFTRGIDKGLVSVVVPIYNAALYLAQCLTSIKMQTYQDLQVILVDDGSTDESGEIAQSFVDADARFSLIHQPNQGQGVARNRGMESATGAYLVFVDADDYINTDFIARHIRALGDADYVQSGYRRVSVEGDILEQKLPHHRYQFTSPCMRLYRTSWLKEHVLTFPIGMIYEDVIFSLLLWGTQPRMRGIHYIGYNYTYNPHSTTSIIHKQEQKELYHTIRSTNAPYWLKLLTILRLNLHFLHS